MVDKSEKLIEDNEIKQLMIERLKVLSPGTVISFGSAGEYTRDQMIKNIENNTEIGELFAEIQIEWLRSFQNLTA